VVVVVVAGFLKATRDSKDNHDQNDRWQAHHLLSSGMILDDDDRSL
jgi:hypothetical protein